jgi:putative transposase
MSTYTRITYQIVFATRNRVAALDKRDRDQLFMHIAGILKNKKCHNLAVNGVEDHIHILCEFHPTIALANLVKDIILGTTDMIIRNRIFPLFPGWQEGYGAFTYAPEARKNLIEYVRNKKVIIQRKTSSRNTSACSMRQR